MKLWFSVVSVTAQLAKGFLSHDWPENNSDILRLALGDHQCPPGPSLGHLQAIYDDPSPGGVSSRSLYLSFNLEQDVQISIFYSIGVELCLL